MPSVKISELPILGALSANNANTVFVVVDKTTNTTSQFSTTVLAQGLYANNILNVGTANTNLLLPNSPAQFISNTEIYSQVNFQNINPKGSGDVVITADNGDNANNYLDIGVQGSNMDPDAEFDLPNNDGYIYMHGKDGQKYGNLWIGTAKANTDIVFFSGGHLQANEVARIEDGVGLSLKMPITFVDASIQTTAASPASVTLAAQANTIVTQGVDAWQNTQITQINQYASSGYAKANAALANTTGTFNGDLTITGNTQILNYVDVVKSDFDANTPLVQITASDNGATVAPSNSYYMLHITGKANNVTRVVADSFGANTYPLYTGRMGRGSAAAPAAVANNDILFRITGNGYTGTQFPSSSPTKIDFVASENFSDANRGTRIEFWNTPTGSNTIQKIANFNANTAEFVGTVNPQKGFIYTPNVVTSGATTLTIDFARDSLIKANSTGGLTVTLTNYVYGKEVILWFTNAGGSTQSVTHGCLANNSTTGSASFSMAAGSTAMLRYFSIDGGLSDTFVAVTQG